jgi:twinkle protein
MSIVQNYQNFDFKGRTSGILKISCPLSGCSGRKNKTDKALSVNLDSRLYKCHHCGESGSLDKYVSDKQYKHPEVKWHNLTPAAMKVLTDRGITERVIIRNKIQSATKFSHVADAKKEFIAFPYWDGTNVSPTGYKYRAVDGKEFGQEANARPLMYNIPFWKDEKEVIIVEGEIDVLSFNVAEIWNVTSVNAGAINENDKNIDGKLQCLYESHSFFSNKEKIYLFCDNDGPGKRLQLELARKLGTYRCYIIKPPEGYKDANEILSGNKEKGLPALGPECLMMLEDSAELMPISGVHYAGDYKGSMVDRYLNGEERGHSTHWPDLDNIFRWKQGNLNLIVGYANQGKSYTFYQILLTKSIYDGWKWGIFSPENFPPEDFYDDLTEMIVGKPLNGNGRMSLGEYEQAIDFLHDHIFFVYPDEDQKLSTMFDKFRSLIIAHGINGVVVDPWNQLDSEQGRGDRDDSYLSLKLKECKNFALQTNTIFNIIAHPKNPSAQTGAEMKVVTEYDIAGGAMWANKVDDILSVYAPHWAEDKKNTIREIHKQKTKRTRTGGGNGMMEIALNKYTCRYTEVSSGKVPCSIERAIQYHNNKDFEKQMIDNSITNGFGYSQSEIEMPEDSPF